MRTNGELLRRSGATLAAIFSLAAVGCTIDYVAGRAAGHFYTRDKAAELITRNGYNHPTLDYSHHLLVPLRNCQPNDLVEYDFTAVNQSGESVELSVCKGIGDAATLFVDKAGSK